MRSASAPWRFICAYTIRSCRVVGDWQWYAVAHCKQEEALHALAPASALAAAAVAAQTNKRCPFCVCVYAYACVCVCVGMFLWSSCAVQVHAVSSGCASAALATTRLLLGGREWDAFGAAHVAAPLTITVLLETMPSSCVRYAPFVRCVRYVRYVRCVRYVRYVRSV